jgi:hypothetical protein
VFRTAPNPIYGGEGVTIALINAPPALGNASVSVTELLPNTTYYVKAFYKSSVGITYSDQLFFTTETLIELGEVNLANIFSIEVNGATFLGTIISNGGATTGFEAGFVYSTTSNPEIDGAGVTAITGTLFGPSDFTARATTLTEETEYFVKAYYKNSAGVVYSEEMSFTTLTENDITLGEIGNVNVLNIKAHSATLQSNLISTGAASNNLELGFIYSTNPNPEIDGEGVIKIEVPIIAGTFQTDLLDLTSDTEYFVKAYFINQIGTVYSEEKAFKTEGLNINEINKFFEISVNPNPVSADATISIYSQIDGNFNIALFDMSGAYMLEITSNKFIHAYQQTLIPLSISLLPAGTYTIMVTHGTNIATKQVIVVK